MKKWIFLVLGCLLVVLSSCSGDDDTGDNCVALSFAEPEWLEDLNFVENTNTPAVQIDRFVAANNLDTIQTASGLVYSILDPGDADRPSQSSRVETWYKGYFPNGQVFDQSDVCGRGTSIFTLNGGVIEGWTEGIPKLGRGGKMIMLVRPSLGYGDSPPASSAITPTSVILFEVELLDFE